MKTFVNTHQTEIYLGREHRLLFENKWRIVTLGVLGGRPFSPPRRFSPSRIVACTRGRLGVVPPIRTISCRPVPNPISVTIRTFSIAVRQNPRMGLEPTPTLQVLSHMGTETEALAKAANTHAVLTGKSQTMGAEVKELQGRLAVLELDFF